MLLFYFEYLHIQCINWYTLYTVHLNSNIGSLPSFCPPHFAKARDIKSHSSVRPSVRPSARHKNFNLAHIFWSINDRALIFGMHAPCDRPFQLTPCCDLDLWPPSRSNLLPGGGPQFSEFACCDLISKHMYPLVLPKMAPFCMKITQKKNTGGATQTPFNNNCFRYYYTIYILIIKWNSNM